MLPRGVVLGCIRVVFGIPYVGLTKRRKYGGGEIIFLPGS